MVRWTLRILGAIVLLAVIVAGGVLLLPAERVAQIAAEQLRKATGRNVAITGDVSLSVWPVLGAEVGGLEIGNATWSEQGPMLSTGQAAIGLDARSLLGGEIRITRIAASSPIIRLESRADGRASWQFTNASGTAQIETQTTADEQPSALSIARLEITNATLIYDAEGADVLTYAGVDLALDWPDKNGPARIDAALRPTSETVRVKAEIGNFADFLASKSQPVSVKLDTSAGSAALTGQAALTGDVAGAVSIKLNDTDNFLRALGLAGADLPQGLGRSITATADINLTGERLLSLRNVTADLGANRITGVADVSLNGVPQISANLEAGVLDLRPALGTAGGQGGSAESGGSAAVAQSGWPRAAIDASGLAAFNGEIALAAQSVNLGKLRFGAAKTVLRNDRSRMVFDLQQVQAYDGTLTGEFVINNRNGLSMGGKLEGHELQLRGLLEDLAGLTRLRGTATTNLRFLGVGENLDAIMRSLSGEGRFAFGTGTIEGLDLDALMSTGKSTGGATVYDSLTASFSIADGNLRNQDLLLELPNAEARGEGRIGIGTQDIDFLFTPVALRANAGRGLAIPVRIEGPWSGPRVQPDLGAAIDLNLAEEKKTVESRVRETLENRVKKELGIKAEEGQSLEKAIEQELGNRLKKLFD